MPRTSPVHYIAPSSISITPNANYSANDLAVYVGAGTKIRVFSSGIPELGFINNTYQEWTLAGRNRRLADPASENNEQYWREFTIYARLSKTDKSDGYLVFAPKTDDGGEWKDKYAYVTTYGLSKDGEESEDYWYIRLGDVSEPENDLRTVTLDTGILGTDQFNTEWNLVPEGLHVDLTCRLLEPYDPAEVEEEPKGEDPGPTPYVPWGYWLSLQAELAGGREDEEVELDRWEITRGTGTGSLPWLDEDDPRRVQFEADGKIILSHTRGEDGTDDFNAAVSSVFTITAWGTKRERTSGGDEEEEEEEENPISGMIGGEEEGDEEGPEVLAVATITIMSETTEQYGLSLSDTIVNYDDENVAFIPEKVFVHVRSTDQRSGIAFITTEQMQTAGLAVQYALAGELADEQERDPWNTLAFDDVGGIAEAFIGNDAATGRTDFVEGENIVVRLIEAEIQDDGEGGRTVTVLKELSRQTILNYYNLDAKYVTVNFFKKLFAVHHTVTESGESVDREIETNKYIDPDDTTVNIEAKRGLWTESFLAALGTEGSGGGGGEIFLNEPLQGINDQQLGYPPYGRSGKIAIVWNYSTNQYEWGETGGGSIHNGVVLYDGANVIDPNYTSEGVDHYYLSNHFLSLAHGGVITDDVTIYDAYLTIADRPAGFDVFSEYIGYQVLTKAETLMVTDSRYVTVEWFKKLFTVHVGNDTSGVNTVDPNQTISGSDYTIESKFGHWTASFLSALGTQGGSGNPFSLGHLLNTLNNAQAVQGTPGEGQTIVWKNGGWTFGTAGNNYTHPTDGANVVITAETGKALSSITVDTFGHVTAVGTTSGYMTMTDADNRYITKAFFRSLFQAFNGNTEVTPNNDAGDTINNIKATVGLWTESYLSALGTQGGSSNPFSLNNLLNSLNSSGLAAHGPDGTTIVWKNGGWTFGTAGGASSVSFDSITNKPTTIAGYGITDNIAYLDVVQDFTARHTFANNTWYLAGGELNEQDTIRNTQWGNGTYYDNADTAPLWSMAAIRNALEFRWWNDYWYIGNIRTDDVYTGGFGIGCRNSAGTHVLDCIHISKTGNLAAAGNLELSVGKAVKFGSGSFLTVTSGNMCIVGAVSVSNTPYATRLAGDTLSITYGANNTVGVYMNDSGNIVIGNGTTVSANGYKLDVNGYTKTTRLYLADGVYLEYDSQSSGVKLSGAGFYTESYVSALGTQGSSGGGGVTLSPVLNHINQHSQPAPFSPSAPVLLYYSSGVWTGLTVSSLTNTLKNTFVSNTGNQSISGTLTSSGFAVSGSDDTYVLLAGGGTIALSDIGGGGGATLGSILDNINSHSPNSFAVTSNSLLYYNSSENLWGTRAFSDFVTVSDAQTITGGKTFTAANTFSGTNTFNAAVTIGQDGSISSYNGFVKSNIVGASTNEQRDAYVLLAGGGHVALSNIGGGSVNSISLTSGGTSLTPSSGVITFPAAKTTDYGIIKVHQQYGQAATVQALGTASSRNYGLQIDTNGKAFVNVPWENDNDDTKNTAGSTEQASTKLYLVGAKSQAANPQTYSNAKCYIGTDNCLYSNNTKVLTAHQSLSDYVALAGTQTITGAKTFNGTASFAGGITLASSITPSQDEQYGLGTSSKKFASLYVKDANVSGTLTVGTFSITNLSVSGTFSAGSTATAVSFIASGKDSSYVLLSGSTKALSEFVQTSGTQSVSGSKTFTGFTTLSGAAKFKNICIECNNSGGTSGRSSEINNYSSALHLQYDPNAKNSGTGVAWGITMCKNGGHVAINSDVDVNYRLKVTGTSFFSDKMSIVEATTSSSPANAKNAKLYIGGGSSTVSIYASGHIYTMGTEVDYSDMRMKNVYRFIDDIRVESIALAPVFKFKWKDSDDDRLHAGTSAQYWQDILPETVIADADGRLGMSYAQTALISAVITARKVVDHERMIKELEAESKRQREEINELEKENERLRTEIEQLKAA